MVGGGQAELGVEMGQHAHRRSQDIHVAHVRRYRFQEVDQRLGNLSPAAQSSVELAKLIGIG